jgi:hypothetical protein
MRPGKMVLTGAVAGLGMGIALFLTAAIAARLVYGPQMVPEGKFQPEQINAWYFIWTKLLLGVFFGALLSLLYGHLPLSRRVGGIREGLMYSFWLWVVVHLWGLSHPLLYDGSAALNRDQLFWAAYTLGGFLGLGAAFGWLARPQARATA